MPETSPTSPSDQFRLPNPIPGDDGQHKHEDSPYRLQKENRGQIDAHADRRRKLTPGSWIRDFSHPTDTPDFEIRGEQREVTVLVLDVNSFTAASHRLDSEDIYLIVDEAMHLFVEIIYSYEGMIDKFTGDGLIALFGAPVAHENDPERALRASVEILRELKPLRQRILAQHNFDFQVRIGINTGPVIAGNLGNSLHRKYTVIGDTVNMTSLLENAADPGSVLVSFSTYQRTRRLFDFTPLPPLTLEGYSEPIHIYRPICIRKQLSSVRGLPEMQVQMIGRNLAMAQLHSATNAVRTKKHQQISLISGSAGLGKSRLVVEFCSSLQAQRVRYHWGNCLAHTRSRSMWIVAEIVRNITDITEVDPIDSQIGRLQEVIAAQLLDETVVLPVLLHVLEIKSVADISQDQIDDTICQFLLSFGTSPFVLIFDDLHWIDPGSLQFLISLIDASKNTPLHLILISRDVDGSPANRSILEACATVEDAFQKIQVQALSLEESNQLIDQLIRPTSPEIEELKQVVLARAEGNPFHIEEIVRMLIDNRGIVESCDGWKTTERAKDLLRSVPGTLRGLISARFDQLPDDLRHTLQQAAVLGRSFPARLLETLHDGDMASLLQQLFALIVRQFLVKEIDSTEDGFAFQHALIQEVVYSTLLRRERHRLYGLVADVINDTDFWLPKQQAQATGYKPSDDRLPSS